MKPIISIIFFVLVFSVPTLSVKGETMSSATKWERMRLGVVLLRTELARQDVYTFVTNRATTPRIAPYIHSQCWVDWLPKEDVKRRAYEQEKRDFGLDFIGKLEKIALDVPPVDDLEMNERRARQFVEIAEWLKTSKGYGNYVLKMWSEGMACTSLGAMAVNSKCSVERAEALFHRIDSVTNNLSCQMAILAEEAPHGYQRPVDVTARGIRKELERQWNLHFKSAYIHFNTRPGRFAGLRFEDVKENLHEYAFYCEDAVGSNGCQYATIRNLWGLKKHFTVCICGMYNPMPKQIFDMLRYRRFVGDIPRPPVGLRMGSPDFIDYQDLFHEQWSPFSKDHGENCAGTPAAIIFCHSDGYLDIYTQQLKWQMERRLDADASR